MIVSRDASRVMLDVVPAAITKFMVPSKIKVGMSSGNQSEEVTTVEEQNLDWGQGDIFVIPPWQWHCHENLSGQDSILFSINDRPTLSVLGLHREEAHK